MLYSISFIDVMACNFCTEYLSTSSLFQVPRHAGEKSRISITGGMGKRFGE